MNLKELSKEELQSMSYDAVAYLVLENAGKKMKLLDLFKKVCKLMGQDDSVVEDKIGEFFELLSINKKFVLLPKGYWDLATKHEQSMIVEDEEEEIQEELEETEDIETEENDEEEDIFYDSVDDNDEEEDDLKDLVIIDEEENISE